MDDFREWLSDNLRYFELGGAILLVVLLLFFGIRSCFGGGRKSGSSDSGSSTTQNVEMVNEGTDGDTGDASNPLTEAEESISTLIQSYYKALSDKDAEAVRAVVDELSPTDEPVIANSSVENYQVNQIYAKQGLTEDARFVFVTYTYQCAGISTPVPAASTFYVTKDTDGNWKIDTQAASEPEVSEFMSAQMSDAQVQSITAQVKSDYDAALASSPELASYLNGVGETVSTASSETASDSSEDDGPKVMATTVVNVRDMAGGDESEVIGELDEGEVVTKLGTEGEWTMISYNGQTAYVYTEYLQSAGD